MAVAGTLEIQLLANIARLQKDMDDAKRSVGGAMSAIEKSTAQASAAMNQMGSVVRGLVGSFGALQLMVMADQFTKYNAQLKLATSGLTEYANAMGSVSQISKAAQTDIAATGTLFARITNGTRELGLSQGRVIDITEAVTLALKVSGATAQESSSAMLQLSQAFGSGVLRGEEFNAVNEAAPRLMKALADGIGQPVGALRELAAQGLITSEVMANALPKALSDLRQEATQVQTISGAFVVLKNNLVEFVGTQAQASGSVSVLTGLIGLLAENLGLLTSAAIGLASAKIAQTITGMAIATGTAVTASMTHRAATLAAAQAQAEATATTAALTAARVAELRAAVLMAEGNVALAITTNGLVPAQARAAAAATAHTAALGALTVAQRASSVVSSALTGALGLLGGPVGAITTALGIGVAAWMAWGSASESGEYRATAAIEKSTPEILEDLNRQIAKLRERNALATAGLPEMARNGGEPAERLAGLQRQIADLQAGRGINGGQPLPEAARVDLLQRLLSQYGQLAGAIQSVTEEQKKLDSTGKAATDLLDVRQRLLGINKSYLEDLGKYQAALKAGAITEAEYIKEVSLLATETYRKSDAGKDATKSLKGLNTEAQDQAKLLAELSGLSGSFAEDWARLNTIFGKGKITLDQLTAAQAELLAQQPAFKKEQKDQEDAAKKLIEKWAEEKKIVDELYESRMRQFDADAKVIKSAEDMVKQAEFELSIMGMSNVEREKAIALRQLEATGIDKASLKYAELADAMNKVIGDRAAMQKQIDDFQNVWNSIDRTAQQTFTNIFEGGQDAFTKLRDTLKATLLDLLYQMTVRKWVFNLAANVTGASSGVAGVVGQSVLGQAGNALGLGSMFSGGGTLTGYASQALGAVGLGNVGAGLAGVGGSFASSVGAGLATDALGATVAEGAAAATLGAGSTIGAAIPYIGAALVAGQALGLFDSKGGPKTEGGASDAATIQATVQATLAQFGIRGAGLRVGGFSAADPQGDSLTQLQTALFQGDRALYSRQDRVGNYENVGRSSEELAAAWAEETARITLAALKSSLEPKYQQYLREVDANTSSADAINAALARVTTARTLEERLLELSSTEAENLARARARELDAMDETLRPLLRQIQAQEDLKKRIDETNAALLSSVNEAYEAVRNARGAEVSQLDATVTRLRDYGRTLREFRDGLLLGNLSTLTPGQRLEEARRQLENVAGKARTGDVNAQGQVQGLVSAFLEASATYNASGAGFTSDFAYTQALLTELADSSMAGADVAQLQLDALGVLNQSVLTIPAALTSLAGAITTAIGAGLNPGAASIGALAGGLTGERIKTDAGSVYASASGAASLGNVVYTKNGKTFTLQELQNELIKAIVGGATSQDFAAASAVTGINRADALAALAGTGYESRLPAFRNGGSHMGGWAMVGEGGPELAYMPPARVYSNADTRQIIDIKPLIDRIQSLESTVTDLGRALVAATYDATARAADKTVDGMTNNTSRASFAQATVPVLA